MALIVSPGQNEIALEMQKHGLDIVPHRKRMNEEDPPLDEKFKDTKDPLRIVFVCAMWPALPDAPFQLLDDLYRQAHAQSHAHADHRARQSRLSRQT